MLAFVHLGALSAVSCRGGDESGPCFFLGDDECGRELLEENVVCQKS